MSHSYKLYRVEILSSRNLKVLRPEDLVAIPRTRDNPCNYKLLKSYLDATSPDSQTFRSTHFRISETPIFVKAIINGTVIHRLPALSLYRRTRMDSCTTAMWAIPNGGKHSKSSPQSVTRYCINAIYGGFWWRTRAKSAAIFRRSGVIWWGAQGYCVSTRG